MRHRFRLLQALALLVTGRAGCPAYPFLRAAPLQDPLPQSILSAIQSVNATLSGLLNVPTMPGFAFSASYAGQPLASFGGGLADLSSPDAGAPDPSSALFRIASNTKLFMSLLTHIFHAKGYLRLDDPVNLYAPTFKTMPYDDGFASVDANGPALDYSNVTFRMLASHTSGLPDSLPGILDWTNITTSQAFASISQMPLQNSLYGFPAYSNLGISVLGHLLSEFVAPRAEDLRGSPADLASLLNRFIIGPLGLNHTGYNYTDAVQKELSPGYDGNGNVVGIHSLGWSAPCGVMYSTVVDLNILFQALSSCSNAVNDGSCEKLNLWPSLAKQFLQPVSYLPDGSLIVGSPWETILFDGYVVRTKSGTLDGYSTKSAVLPELRLSFSFIFNGNYPNWYIGDNLLRQVASTLVPAIQQAISPLQPGRPLGPLASSLVGNYSQDADSSGQTVASVQLVNAGGSIGQQLQMTIYAPGATPQVNILGYAAVQGTSASAASGDTSAATQPQLYRLYQTDFTSQNCEHLFMQDTTYGWPVVFTPTGSSTWSLAMSDWTGSWTKTA